MPIRISAATPATRRCRRTRRRCERRRFGGKREQPVDIDCARDRGTDLRDARGRVAGLVARHEPELALDDRKPGLVVDGAQHRHVRVVLDHGPQLRFVAAAAQLVEDHAGDSNVAVERLVAEDERRDAAGHAAGVDDQHHRQVEHPGDRGVAVAAVEREPVVEALVALDERDVGAGGVTSETRADLGLAGEVRVEVAAAPPAREREPHRVDVVRSLLECLDHEPARAHRRGEPDGNRRLAGRLVCRGDEETAHARCLQSAPAPCGAGFASPGRKSSTRTPTSATRNAMATPPTPSAHSGTLGA